MAHVYYNEFDAYTAWWLRHAIDHGDLPQGVVDDRDMRVVDPSELDGYAAWHFFAGIGGWPLALRMVGWRDEWPVMTGSPPCQPFSVAGRRLGKRDERHLAPKWLEFVRHLRPPILFGEQVANAIQQDEWLDDLFDHLEAEGYSTGALVLQASIVGAPHRRERIFFYAFRPGEIGFLEDADDDGWQLASTNTSTSATSWIEPSLPTSRTGLLYAPWSSGSPIECVDQKVRLVEPSIRPLAHGVPARVGRIRAYGNAIVPTLGALFVWAFLDGVKEGVIR